MVKADLKTCFRCRIAKSPHEFYATRIYISSRNPLGLSSSCRGCLKVARSTTQARRRRRAYFRRWESDPAVKERRRILRNAPARQAQKREYTRQYRQQEHAKAQRRAYQRGEAYQRYRRAYYEAHKEIWRMSNRKHYARHYARRSTDAEYRKRKDAQTIIGIMRYHGWIQPKPCEVCGVETPIEGHHPDYGRPLEVVWLCPLHHKLIHFPFPRKSGIQKASSPLPNL